MAVTPTPEDVWIEILHGKVEDRGGGGSAVVCQGRTLVGRDRQKYLQDSFRGFHIDGMGEPFHTCHLMKFLSKK